MFAVLFKVTATAPQLVKLTVTVTVTVMWGGVCMIEEPEQAVIQEPGQAVMKESE